MKTKFYLTMAIATLLMSNCSQEEVLNQVQGGTNTLTATIEGASRSAVTDAGVFSWTSGDEISVYNGEDFTTFTLSSGNAFTSNETITPSGVAIYPAGSHTYNGTTTKVNMATSYSYGSTNAPMVAEVTNTTLAFKHVGGLMRFIVKGMPSTATSFTFTANTGITGDFEVSDDVITATTASESNKTVTINFTAEQYDAESMTFYIPLPTGTYEGYTVSIGDSQDMSDVSDATVKNTIARGTLLLMPTFTYDTTNGLSKSNDGGVVTLEGGEQNLEVSGTQAVEVDANSLSEAGAVLNLNYTPAENNSTLTLSESGDETESQEESAATVSISVPNNSTVNELDITMPSMTVELNAEEGETATYTTVNALTAQNTLKIGKGVSVGTLNIKGGHIRLGGSITTEIKREGEGTDIIYIILEEGVTAPTVTLPENVKAVTAAEWDLRKAIEKADAGSTVTLENNVELTNQLTITKSLTLNLNGKTISNTTDIWNGAEGIKTWSLISVQEGVVVTVKGNGRLQAKSGDCYAIDVRDGATVNLEDGTYVGNISAVYAINNATANIKGGTYSIQQKSEYDDYRYLLNLKDNSQSSIVVTGGTFANYDPANSNGENPIANLVASGYSSVADGNNNYVVSEGIKNEKALIAAIAGAGANATITLANDIVLTEQLTITKSLTLNLNGKTISNTTDIWNDTEGIKTWSLISVQGEKIEVTLTGEGTLQAKNGDCFAVDVRNGAIVNLENGTYVGNISAVYAHEGTANINGGIYKIQQLSEHNDYRYVVNCLDENYTAGKASIVVKGGQFYSFNPNNNLAEGTETNFVAEGYTISEKTENETTIYTVSESGN